MGGSSKPKKPSNAERTASILAQKKSSGDAKALLAQGEYLRNRRKRSPLFGGPESGGGQTTLGSQGSTLGAMG